MGQKTNPNVLRLGITKNWKSRYFEKKSTEIAIYDFKSIEIQKFACKFFKNNGFNIHNCRVNYSPNGTINIFISYYVTPEQKNFYNKSKEYYTELEFVNLMEKIENYISYQTFKYIKKLDTYNEKTKKLNILKNKLRRNYFNLTCFNEKEFLIEKYDNIRVTRIDYFLNYFFESLSTFVNKKINFFLTLQQLNTSFKNNLKKKNLAALKKSLVRLSRLENNKFLPPLKESINILFIAVQQPNSANLLAEFIANRLKKLKRHNLFLKFIKKCLKILKKYSKLKGIQIKITGRLNKSRRARHKTIKIYKKLPVFSIKSNIDYAEQTSYTPNGTIGVKVWTYN